ncbi:hypothetical protein FRB99_001369, partial [Tulasnella sp. 403]
MDARYSPARSPSPASPILGPSEPVQQYDTFDPPPYTMLFASMSVQTSMPTPISLQALQPPAVGPVPLPEPETSSLRISSECPYQNPLDIHTLSPETSATSFGYTHAPLTRPDSPPPECPPPPYSFIQPAWPPDASADNPIRVDGRLSDQDYRMFSHGLGQHSSRVFMGLCLPGLAIRKRPRRRYGELERIYQCNWDGCTKSYPTSNHLNAHVPMQRHGAKRTPA